MQNWVFKALKSLFGLLFFHFYEIFADLFAKMDNIPWRHLITDFFSVVRSSGMFSVLNFIAFFVFTILPQGRDVLLIVVEEIAVQHRFGNLICMLIGAFIWSVVSEYGCRYAIYVTDNSGNSLSNERIQWKKAVETLVAQLFLLTPFLILFTGFLINYLNESSLKPTEKKIGFGVPVACLYLVLNVVAKAYFSKEKTGLMSLKIFSLMELPAIENRWCNKLIGIYNDYVFTLRKPSNFSSAINPPFIVFSNNFLLLDDTGRMKFLQQPENMDPDAIVPEEFQPLSFCEYNVQEDEQYKWIYRIPISFYKTLHLQLKIIVFASLAIFTIICFLPLSYYEVIGAPGLVIIAFTCWSGIYVGILYLDHAILRNSKFSMRFLLFTLLVISSFLNSDHPVRYNEHGLTDNRPVLSSHFDKWFEKYKKDSAPPMYKFSWIIDTPYPKGKDTPYQKVRYPVIFVCAEGGALRTGAFAAQTLSFLQDNFLRVKDSFLYKKAQCMDKAAGDSHKPATYVTDYNAKKMWQQEKGNDFKRSIYAYSGVSGGSLGLAFFNAIAYLIPSEKWKADSLSELTQAFFEQDYLSPVIGKMFYGDFLNLFIPFHIERFDRAIALEKSWEKGFLRTIRPNATDIFSDDYLGLYSNDHLHPAMFINTTEVESGKQCWLSNVKPDKGMYFPDERDLFNTKIKGGINFSTMINFSSRFPLFSPGANLTQNENFKLHYVDGGYVENTGAGTMLEILESLKENSKHFQNDEVVPFVFVLRFGDDKDDDFKDLSVGNEMLEVVTGIYNTRIGRTTTATAQLERFTEEKLHGKFIPLCLSSSGSQVPLNWVLSSSSLDNLKKDIENKWQKKQENQLNKFFLVNSGECVRVCGY
jgi:hypothetical protein